MASSDGERPVRRVRRRGSSGGHAFSRAGLSSATSGSAPVAEDDYDEADEVEDLNAAVIEAMPAPRPLSPPQRDYEETIRSAEDGDATNFNPRSRLAQVRSRSTKYEREYRLKLLHRLLMRGLPLDEIAANLGVSVRTVLRDRDELGARFKDIAKKLDVEYIIGDSAGFYDEVQAMAMRAASSNSIPVPIRLAAMRTALASQNDKHKFLQAAGVYESLRYRKGADDGTMNDIQQLMSLTEELLSRTEKAAQDPLGDFSTSGDDEIVDI